MMMIKILKHPARALVAAVIGLVLQLPAAPPAAAGPLEDLDKPMEGRSMRATSTMRVGEVRRGGTVKLFPRNPPRGDTNELSNQDNFRVPPG